MLAHLLNKRILLQEKTSSRNAMGTPEDNWVDYRYTWAGVKYTGGGTDFEELGEIASTQTEFIIRYNPDIDYYFKIIYNNQKYKILHIEVTGNNEGLRLKTIRFEDE